MTAAYDSYDYPSYWIGRGYEHACEKIALARFLSQISKIDNILDIGAGYGRMTPSYSYRAKKVILSDPSGKLLKIAQHNYSSKKFNFINCGFEYLPKKIKKYSIDLVILIRVLHHVENIDKLFKVVDTLIKKNGYFILEFANKSHFKATASEFLKGNFTFPIDIFPKDLRSKHAKKNKVLPFYNYHHDIIENKLWENNFEIIDKRSISNFRLNQFKNLFPKDFLINMETKLQKPLARINFGPSIMLLCRKRA
jgi:ubiquinone/menaquinone biosynthesis C-methylase UbiE